MQKRISGIDDEEQREIQEEVLRKSVPLVLEQHEPGKGLHLPPLFGLKILSTHSKETVDDVHKALMENFELKSLVLYPGGKPIFAYDGTEEIAGGRSMCDGRFILFHSSGDPILKTTVFCSYYARK
ncbi:MAG: hypothetical protein II393_03765 [Cytophagales bacterium]|nr:hypothetical protein [Cytophagales bacterium]